MKRTLKQTLLILICVTFLFFLIKIINSRFVSQGAYEKYYDFYCTDFQNYDVLFLGSSRMELAISPIELWKYSGIMSYNLSNYGQQLPVNYWVLVDALTRTTPQLVVIDTSFVSSDEKEGGANVNHECLDLVPLSINKVNAINDIFPREERFEYYFNFPYYHSRWSEVTSEFWNEHRSYQKGGNIFCDHNVDEVVFCEQSPYQLPDISERILTDTVNKEYLRKMINLCKGKNINVLLINCPSYRGIEQQRWFDSVNDIAQEYDVTYMDFNRMKTDLDPLTDYRDEGHLDNSGARKFTKLLGDILINDFNVDCEHTGEEIALWKDDYSKYLDFKISKISNIKSLPTYLMTLNDEDFDIIIEANSIDSLKNAQVINMLKNLGLNNPPQEKSFIVIDGGSIASFFSSEEDSVSFDTPIGVFQKSNIDDTSAEYGIFLDNKLLYPVGKESSNNEVTRITILDASTHDILDYKAFSYEETNMMNAYGN